MLEDHWLSGLNLILMVLIALYLKKIPEEMRREVTRLDEDIWQAKKEVTHMLAKSTTRIDKEVATVKAGVVYKDVFEQFAETQNARHQTTEKIYQLLAKQMEHTSTQNTKEHDRICGKMDSIPLMIKDELDRGLKYYGAKDEI